MSLIIGPTLIERFVFPGVSWSQTAGLMRVLGIPVFCPQGEEERRRADFSFTAFEAGLPGR